MSSITQKPDTKPGNYYVTAIDGERHACLVGPFKDDHAAALALVDKAKKVAFEVDPKAVWYAYGTCRTDYSYNKPGVLNDRVLVN